MNIEECLGIVRTLTELDLKNFLEITFACYFLGGRD